MRFATKLLLAILAVVLSAAGMVYLTADRTSSRFLEDSILDNLNDDAIHTMDKIDRMMFERLADVQIIATDPVIRSRGATPEEIVDRLVHFRNIYKAYASLSFFDLGRNRIADTAGLHVGDRHELIGYWEDVLKGNVSAASDIRVAEDLEMPIIYFAAPVRDDNGEAFGVVAARMPISRLHDMTRGAGGIEPDDNLLLIDLVDKNGLLLYSNYNEKGILREKIDMNAEFNKPTVGHPEAGEATIMAKATEKGYLDFKGNGWTLLLHEPLKYAWAPVARMRVRAALTVLPVLGIAALVVFLLSRSLSRPVARLTIAASEIGRGNFNTKIDISSKDELGVLARELDQMKDSLKSSKEKIEGYSHSLEETVRERTAELNKKMAELEKYNEVMLSVLDDTDEAKRKLQETLDELKTTSDKLIQAGKLSGIGQMAAGIAHEINNPLTSILGYAQLMMSNAGLDPQIREDLTRIERESKRCVTIIENLLAFARPTPSQKEPLSVNDIVDNTLKVIEYSITREKINIIKEMDTGLPMVMADPYQLQQVFMNLVINAVRAMPDGGDLTISTKVRSSKSTSNLGTSNSEPADLVEISFADTGHGIADNVKEKIFEPFFSTSYQRGQKGSGLGLSISHSIVAEHGGRLEFESAEGKGTTFKVLLPVA